MTSTPLPDSPDWVSASDLGMAGIAGAAGGVLSAGAEIAAGANATFSTLPALILWNWSYQTSPSGAPPPPTKGASWLAAPSGGTGATDSLTIYEGGSNRLAGLRIGAGAIVIQNNFDESVFFAISYSVITP